MTPAEEMARLGAQAKDAARAMTRATPEAKNQALLGLAQLLHQREPEILAANARDIEAARAAGQDAARLDRLTLTSAIMEEMRAACAHVANLPDPVGATESQWQRPNGLLVGKMRIPLGVIAMVYEARPNVTIDAAILCIKAGNAVILRGGSEAIHSNTALAQTLQEAMVQAGLPASAAQLVTVPGHEAVNALCKLDQYIDVIIPRGGEGLVRAVTEAATMPVLKHFKGVCHAYIEPDADLERALDIVFNGKVQRPGVCNALECLLVHKDAASAFLPLVAEKLGAVGVEFRADTTALPLMNKAPLFPSGLKTLVRNFMILFSPFAWWTVWMKRWTTLPAMDPTIQKSSAPMTMPRPCAFCAKPMPPWWRSMHPAASTTAGSSAWARRSAYPPPSCMLTGPWALKN